MPAPRRLSQVEGNSVAKIGNFRVWHFSDLPILAANVGFEGLSGSASDVAKPTRLTRNGHRNQGGWLFASDGQIDHVSEVFNQEWLV